MITIHDNHIQAYTDKHIPTIHRKHILQVHERRVEQHGAVSVQALGHVGELPEEAALSYDMVLEYSVVCYVILHIMLFHIIS